MVEIGYALMSEEHAPYHLVANAGAAEEAGFSCALISDDYVHQIGRDQAGFLRFYEEHVLPHFGQA